MLRKRKISSFLLCLTSPFTIGSKKLLKAEGFSLLETEAGAYGRSMVGSSLRKNITGPVEGL